MIDRLGYNKQAKLVQALAAVHEYLKQNYEISSVSLRDISRFREIYEWFYGTLSK